MLLHGGNLLAGAVGTLWSTLSSAVFFSLMAGTCMLVAVLMLRLERRARPLLAGNAAPAPQRAAAADGAVTSG